MKTIISIAYIYFFLQLSTLIKGQSNFYDHSTVILNNSQKLISTNRVTSGLQVLYNFSEGSGTQINDYSNVGSPLNLTLNNINSVKWNSPGLTIMGEMNIKSANAATKITNACKSSNEVTYEVWFNPTDTIQRGVVARMMAMTFSDVHTNNIKFWQNGSGFGFHCRTSTSPANGYEWKIYDYPAKLTHFVFSHSQDGIIKLYVDSKIILQDTVDGDFSTWDDTYKLFVGSDYGTSRYWLGTFYLMAIYDRALTETEVNQNYTVGLETFDLLTIQITDITVSNLIGDASNGGKYGGHGVMFGDADGDGDADMYITMNNNAEMPDQYFENNGGVFTEKALERGIANNDLKGSHGWIWADLDNDGDYDGWNGSYSKNIPYRNRDDQPGYFEDMFTVSGIEDIDLGTRGVAAFDYDNDGDLDLFGNNWYARSTYEENEFYRNDGNFTFTRIDNGLSNAKGDQGVCEGDFDNDGDVDLLLSVFEGNVDGRCVEIWENVDGEFVRLENSGLALCNASYDGTTFWDMDNDGLLDVVSKEKIFRNNGDKTFSEASNIPSGPTYPYMRGIADLNNDGYWDIVVPGVSPVYINNGDMTFSEVSYGLGTINDPRCVSFSDIDGDGDVDFALGQKRTYNRLYRNDYSGTNRWIFVKLRTAENQIGAYGTKVYIYTTEGDTLLSYREAHSSQGYLSQDDPTLHFGCGQREQVKVKVKFLNGHTSELVTFTNKTIEIIDFYPDTTAPAAPHNLIAEIQDGNIKLSWGNNTEPDLYYYAIYRSIDSSFSKDQFPNYTYSTMDSILVDTLINYGVKYYYSVTAFDSSENESEFSEIVSGIIIDTIPPGVPSGLEASLQNNSITLSWLKNYDADLAYYAIYKSQDPNFLPDSMSSYTYSTTDTFYIDSDIINGNYYYRISAYDIHNNESDFSEVIEVVVTNLENLITISTDYELYQNYPNPFNPSTQIDFNLKNGGFVRLHIFNIVGEVVETLVQEKLSAGKHSISFNANNLPNGVYFYEISSDNFHSVKKMMILK